MLSLFASLGQLFASMAVDSASMWILFQGKEPKKPADL